MASREGQLTLLLAVLIVGVSLAGLVADGLYDRELPAYAAELQGHDVFNLVVAVPVLVGAFVMSSRSRLAWLVWIGTLIYLTYAFATYAFAVHFNALFTAYVVIMGLAVWGFVSALVGADSDTLRRSFGVETPVPGVSAFLLFFGIAFYIFWLTQVLPASIDGTLPEEVLDSGILTNPIHVIDMSLYLPAFVITGLLLRRGHPLGYMLTLPLLVSAVLILSGLAARVFGAMAGDHPADAPELIVLLGFAVLSLGVALWFARGATQAQRRAAASP